MFTSARSLQKHRHITVNQTNQNIRPVKSYALGVRERVR